ncbi:3955_t:CDS:1, partial [Cetraspora pellucida]
ILEDDDLLTFNHNHPFKNYYTSVNSSTLSKNNLANNKRQAQAKDLNILEPILQKIAARFKETIVEVAA